MPFDNPNLTLFLLKLGKLLNNINKEKEIINNTLKKSINYYSKIDYTNQTKELKYSMYDGLELILEEFNDACIELELIYEEFNDAYIEYIESFSKSYIEMSDFYVGPFLPKDLFYKKIWEYFFNVYFISVYYMNYQMAVYEVD